MLVSWLYQLPTKLVICLREAGAVGAGKDVRIETREHFLLFACWGAGCHLGQLLVQLLRLFLKVVLTLFSVLDPITITCIRSQCLKVLLLLVSFEFHIFVEFFFVDRWALQVYLCDYFTGLPVA